MTAVMYQVTGFMCSFVYGMGLQPRHKTAGDAHHFIFFHVWPPNQQPTIRGVDLCHKNVRHPWSTETHVIRHYPFVSAHNAPFHSKCNTNDKSSNKTCDNNIIPPSNIQYFKIHVRNWIRSQTSQWYTNRMKWTWGDKLQPTAVRWRWRPCWTRIMRSFPLMYITSKAGKGPKGYYQCR